MNTYIRVVGICAFVLSAFTVTACDGCSGNIGLSLNSLLNTSNRSFLSARWDRSVFESTETTDHEIRDLFQVVQLSGRYRVSDKLTLSATLPYAYNSRSDGETDLALSGMGDATVGFAYAVLNTTDRSVNIYSELGALVSIPTSSYDDSLHDMELPQNFNLGRGAFAYAATASIALKGPTTGLVANASYTYQTSSSKGYRFGDRVAARLSTYKSQPLSDKLTLVGLTGLQYDRTAKERYGTGLVVQSSGGYGLFAPVSVGLSTDQWMLQTEYGIPMHQNFINDELRALPNWSVQLIYFFNN